MLRFLAATSPADQGESRTLWTALWVVREVVLGRTDGFPANSDPEWAGLQTRPFCAMCAVMKIVALRGSHAMGSEQEEDSWEVGTGV